MYYAVTNLIFWFICIMLLTMNEKPVFCGIFFASLFVFRNLIHALFFNISSPLTTFSIHTFFSIMLLCLISIIYFWAIKKFSGTPIAQGLILAGFLLSISPLK